ncbi:hypothetical protein Taro_050840 [Colocasia esculenta]|uniref:Secreted protein n=1 Tax=Colocasia esculenta TaxID=4460 RepID=A0A843XF55_COLES|nr:hypothetical protein [Colocasia esculenta]
MVHLLPLIGLLLQDRMAGTHVSTPAFFSGPNKRHVIKWAHPANSSIMQGIRQPNNSTPWSTELCHYCDCLITSVCSCITFGQIVEIVDRGNTKRCGLSRANVRAVGVDGAGVPLLVVALSMRILMGKGMSEEHPY